MKAPVGQVALAALIQPSHRPLETLMVDPPSVASRVNFAVPEAPVVEEGEPLHFVIAPGGVSFEKVGE